MKHSTKPEILRALGFEESIRTEDQSGFKMVFLGVLSITVRYLIPDTKVPSTI